MLMVSLWPLLCFLSSFLRYFGDGKSPVKRQDAFGIVAFVWFALGLLGGLAFLFRRNNTSSITSALFESVSGFTTTGATVLSDIEAVSSALQISGDTSVTGLAAWV